MKQLSKTLKNPSYLQSSLTLLLFFASWGVWWSFFQLWLTSTKNGLGLSGSAVGTIYSANSFITLILMFVYGTLQDKLIIKRYLLIFCAVLDALIGPFFVWIYAPLLHHNFFLGI
ncbi:MFS transporter, partial [Lactobacillus sp. XV13L]|nr:MFS transporter [Lactobacillus sp. XV13L]